MIKFKKIGSITVIAATALFLSACANETAPVEPEIPVVAETVEVVAPEPIEPEVVAESPESNDIESSNLLDEFDIRDSSEWIVDWAELHNMIWENGFQIEPGIYAYAQGTRRGDPVNLDGILVQARVNLPATIQDIEIHDDVIRLFLHQGDEPGDMRFALDRPFGDNFSVFDLTTLQIIDSVSNELLYDIPINLM
jgi:hypothetical protein